MLSKLIKIVIIVALITLVISLFPVTYEWCKIAIEWILSQGKWGIIALVACILSAIFS